MQFQERDINELKYILVARERQSEGVETALVKRQVNVTEAAAAPANSDEWR